MVQCDRNKVPSLAWPVTKYQGKKEGTLAQASKRSHGGCPKFLPLSNHTPPNDSALAVSLPPQINHSLRAIRLPSLSPSPPHPLPSPSLSLYKSIRSLPPSPHLLAFLAVSVLLNLNLFSCPLSIRERNLSPFPTHASPHAVGKANSRLLSRLSLSPSASTSSIRLPPFLSR
jgi:hypothetical protein